MIGGHNHHRTERRLYRMFTKGADERTRRRLLAEVDTCEKCRAICRCYHRYEAVLSFSDEACSPSAADRMALGIFTRLSTQNKERRRLVFKAVGALASATAVLLLAWMLLIPKETSHRVNLPAIMKSQSVELVSRGGPRIGSPDFGIRVFSVSKDERRVAENSGPTLHDLLTFTYTRVNSKPGFLAIFGVQESSDIIWYYPDYGEEQSIEIQGDRVDEPLGDGFDVSVNHRAGLLLIVAIFSEKPISTLKIEALVKNLKRDAHGFDRLYRYAWGEIGSDVAVYSILSKIRDSNE